MDTAILTPYGIDGERGLKNCMDSSAFYKKILSMFLQDGCFAHAQAACQAGERKEFFSRMHELKGISGNAALTELYDACVPLVELLRREDGAPEEIARRFAAVECAYKRACEGIRLFLAAP